MTAPENPRPKNRLERHGKWILAGFVAFSFVLMVAVTERILKAKPRAEGGWTFPKKTLPVERGVRLREWPPNGTLTVVPPSLCTEGLALRPYTTRIDPDGYILPSQVNESPDLTLLFLGGSTTECMFMDEADRFPYAVGREVEEKTGKKTNAYNAGHSGNHTMHSVALLVGKGLGLRPDYAILHHAINDVVILLYYGSYWNENRTRSLLTSKAQLDHRPPPVRLAGLELLRSITPNIAEALTADSAPTLTDEFADVRGKALRFDKEEMLRQFRSAEKTYVETCRAYGIKPILLTQASRMTEQAPEVVTCYRDSLFAKGIDYAGLRDLHRSFNEATRELGKELGVTVVDLEAKVPQTARNMYDTVHYTGEGSRLAASLIAEAIVGEFNPPSADLSP